MTFDPNQCWDCPIPVAHLLLSFALGLTFLLLAATLATDPRSFQRALGRGLLVLVALGYAGAFLATRRWGITWGSQRTFPSRSEQVLSSPATLFVYLAWLAFSVASAASLWIRLRGRRRA
jgi:hypothetical protein